MDTDKNGSFSNNSAVNYTQAVSATDMGLSAGKYPIEIVSTTTTNDTIRRTDSIEIVYLTLPDTIDVLSNDPFEIYFDNIFLTQNITNYTITVNTLLPGSNTAEKWQFTPSTILAGNYALEITIKNANLRIVDIKKTIIRLVESNYTLAEPNHNILLLGHSLISPGSISNKLANLSAANGMPYSFKGRLSTATPNSRFEGTGGVNWNWYLATLSPFYYNSQIDIPNYITTYCNNKLDYTIIYLDINDYFGTNPSTIANIDNAVAAKLIIVENLIQKFRTANPFMKIAICLMAPANSRQSAFTLIYPTSVVNADRWRWRQIQHRVIYKYQNYFSNKQTDNLFVIPLYLNIDCTNGYPFNNAVHPNVSGYNQIGRTIYAWLRQKTKKTVTLPIKLLSFSGENISYSNHLKWATGQIANAKGIELQKSADGKSFYTIHTEDVNNLSNHYEFNDKNIDTNISYYRLKLIYLDGAFEYSKVIAVVSNTESPISLFPNPTSNTLTVNTPNNDIITAATIYTVDGTVAMYIQNDLSSLTTIDISTIPHGVYIIKITTSKNIITRFFSKI